MKGWIIIALALLLVVLLIVLLRTTSGLTSGASTCTACPITTSQYYTAASGCGIASCPASSYTTGDTNSVGVSSCTPTPLQALLTSAKAIQVPAVDPATLTGTWGAAITPTDPTGPAIKYSFTMDVNLDSTWSAVAGSAYPVFTHAGGSPSFYINNGGGANATWGADATNGVLIYQATAVGQLMQVYNNSFTPGGGWKNITIVCDGTYVRYYVNGVEDTNISDAANRTNTTGVKWNSGVWAWAGLNQGGQIPTGKSQIRNFYWWSDKALSAAERTTLLRIPASSLIASGTALQVSEIDLGAVSVPATNKPTLTIGPVTTGFSLSMWVKLPATVTPGVWWTLFGMDGHYVTLMPDTGTPTLWEIVFSTTGPAGQNWSYMYRLTPGTYYRLGFVVSPPSAPTFYLDGGSGMTGSNMIGTGAVSHGSTGSDARFNPNNSPLTGIKVKNAYYFGKSLTASEMALLGASGMGSGTTSGYMPEPFTAEKDFAGY